MELILQGLTDRTHAAILGEMFANDVERAIISVAFLSDDGVNLIEPLLAPQADKITVFAAIRNEITSAQAMKRLLAIGVSLFAVDTGSRTLLFHPKMYHVRRDKTAQLSVGSANLTLGGLNNNIEAGLLLDLNLDDEDDSKLVEELESSFDGLAGEHPDNVFKIGDDATIDGLLDAGRLIDEEAAPPSHPANKSKSNQADATPLMKLAATRIRGTRRPAKKPKSPDGNNAGGGNAAFNPAQSGAPTTGISYELVWVSKELEERDLNIPTGPTTNATGSINLDKGLMAADVDHRHYFRETVFPALDWPTQSAPVDTASATFAMIVKGIDHGTHTLTVRHTTSTTSASYHQNNAMTRISWGALRPVVGDKNLLKRHLSLYRDTADPTRFKIEID